MVVVEFDGFVRIADMKEADMNIDACAGAGACGSAGAEAQANARAESRTNASDAESPQRPILSATCNFETRLGSNMVRGLLLIIWVWASTI